MSAVEPLRASADPTVPAALLPSTTSPALPRVANLKTVLGTALVRTGPMLVYKINRVGRTGAVGAAMLLFAAIFFLSAVLPQQRQLAQLDAQIRLARSAGSVAETAPVRLGRFMKNLPRRTELPRIVGQVFALAGAAQVTLDRGRYELSPLRAGHLAQYRMTFPIKGRYPDIRKFIDTVLIAIPSASLEGLRVERKAVGEESVAADLRFAVFVRNET